MRGTTQNGSLCPPVRPVPWSSHAPRAAEELFARIDTAAYAASRCLSFEPCNLSQNTISHSCSEPGSGWFYHRHGVSNVV